MSNTFNTVPTPNHNPMHSSAEPTRDLSADVEMDPGTDPVMGSESGTRGSSPRDEAGRVADVAADAAHRVLGSGRDGAARVTAEAKTQTQGLVTEARAQLSEQAGAQQTRVAEGLRSLSDELSTMVNSSDGTGMAHDLVQQLASRAGSVSSWLDTRDPAALLQEARTFARRKPGAFIFFAVTAGVLAGRLTRNAVANGSTR